MQYYSPPSLQHPEHLTGEFYKVPNFSNYSLYFWAIKLRDAFNILNPSQLLPITQNKIRKSKNHLGMSPNMLHENQMKPPCKST